MSQISLSEQGYPELELFRLHVKGGLIFPDKTQIILGTFMERSKNFSPKVTITHAIGSDSTSKMTQEPSSIRFDNPIVLDALIFHLMRSNVKLGKKTGIITSKNIEAMLHQAYQKIEGYYRGFLE